MYKKFGKRLFDVIASVIVGLLLLPIFIIIAILIKTSSKGSIFYTQKRVGKNFKIFNIYKFRTMVENADKIGPSVTSGDDPRITKIGKFLRKTKFDEFPQLINVIKGDMSLVGPRPELMKFVQWKMKEYKTVLSVRPGFTDNAGLAYIDEERIMEQYEDKEKAYIDIILPEEIKLYQLYIKNINFFRDIELLLKTIKAI